MEQGWDGTFLAGDAAGAAQSADAQILYLPIRAKLTPTTAAPGAFPALLALLEQFSSAEKRIDLTRVAIRADDQGRYTTELNLRMACLISNANAPQ